MKIKSFSTRLSLNIVFVATAIFVAAFSIFFSYARKIEMEMAIDSAKSMLSSTSREISSELQKVEVALESMIWLIDKRETPADSLYTITRRLVTNNPNIYGSAVAYIPNYYKDKGRYFSPYAHISGDDIVEKQLGSDSYNYFEMEWFAAPVASGEAQWSEPYFDKDGANIMMSTYSMPIKNHSGEVYAVMTADISLEWLSEVIGRIKPYASSCNGVISRKGVYIAEQFGSLTIDKDSSADHLKGTILDMIKSDTTSGEYGVEQLTSSDQTLCLLYTGVDQVGWSVAMVSPEDEVFAKLDGMKSVVIIVISLGVLLLLTFCYNIIYNMSIPLRKVAESAHNIAEGDFTAQLPETKHHDEISELRDSFDYMQHSLVEYIEKLKSATSSKERIESELRIAHDIQMGMIPKIFPPFPEKRGIDLYAKLEPAKEVGGDLYDFFIRDNRLYFAVGDVSGKGVPASLFMAVSKSLFRSVSAHFDSPAMILKSLNSSISENNEANMFITMFAATIDLRTGQMLYCNAGHTPPVVVRDGASTPIKMKANIPIGLFDGFGYQDETLKLDRHDMLIVYTDGVSEAESPSKELYGEKRLYSLLESCSDMSASEVIDRLFRSVEEHADGAEQSDDITILTIKIDDYEL